MVGDLLPAVGDFLFSDCSVEKIDTSVCYTDGSVLHAKEMIVNFDNLDIT